MTVIINGRLIVPNEHDVFMVEDHRALIFREDTGMIESIVPEGQMTAGALRAMDNVIDAEGGYVSPGFINVHIHGAMGCDTMDATPEALETISRHQATTGVTSILPTTMTYDFYRINRALDNVRKVMERELDGAAVIGANMEGPFISRERCGAQKVDFVQPPDWSKIEPYKDVIRLLTLAPEELHGDYSFVDKCNKAGIVVSMGHSTADYNLARRAILQYGITHLTHIFNGMAPFHHRTPGLVGAALDTDSDCEMICDNVHLHSVTQRLIWRMKQGRQIILVTDSIRATGLPDGESELGGQKVYVKGQCATLADGTIAGSVLTMDRAIANFTANTGCGIAAAVVCATKAPAQSLGIYGRCGSLTPGKQADITIFRNAAEIQMTIVRGKTVYTKS